MTKRKELEALAERCERAEGADYVLDILIAKTLGWEIDDYTGRLDAAMGLVPEGYSVEMGRYVTTPRDDGPTGCRARVSQYCHGDGPRWESVDRSDAATLPLALCAAGLRARAAGEA